MSHVLFEDQGFGRLRPIADSSPTWELRCGMFNTRERIELAAGITGGGLLGRTLVTPLVTAPGWTPLTDAPSGRSLWWSGRLAPDGALVDQLLAQGASDWALQDEHGLLAASLAPDLSSELLAAWRVWEAGAWEGADLVLPEAIRGLPAPDVEEGAKHELGWIWDLVPATADALAADLQLVGDREVSRHPCGLVAEGEAPWSRPGGLTPATPRGVHLSGSQGLFLGDDVTIAPGTHVDTRNGPVVLDTGVEVAAHCFLEGPLYLGRGTRVKPGARIFGETSCGVGNRLAGEIGESTFGDFANKQHDGFIGHAVLGSWINLGAMTTCSDLKNNYGNVRVDLGEGQRDTGLRFVGLMMGDHAKTAIGTLFNTGSVVGFAANVFGDAMPAKLVRSFSWGGAADAPATDPDRACATAEIVVRRRGCAWTPDHEKLFRFLAGRG